MKTKAAQKQGGDWPITKVCEVRLNRLTPQVILQIMRELKAQPHPRPNEVSRALEILRSRGITAELAAPEVVYISSDDDLNTPPRPVRERSSRPSTPSPVVSPQSEQGIRRGTTPHDDWSWLLASPVPAKPNGLPITPGRGMQANSPSGPSLGSTIVGSPGSDVAYLQQILEGLPKPEYPRPLAVPEAVEGTGDKPRLKSVVVIPKAAEKRVEFVCARALSPDTDRELQPHLEAALALHRPGNQYKRVVEVRGKRLRILVGRKGNVTVIPRGQEDPTPGKGEV